MEETTARSDDAAQGARTSHIVEGKNLIDMADDERAFLTEEWDQNATIFCFKTVRRHSSAIYKQLMSKLFNALPNFSKERTGKIIVVAAKVAWHKLSANELRYLQSFNLIVETRKQLNAIKQIPAKVMPFASIGTSDTTQGLGIGAIGLWAKRDVDEFWSMTI